MNNTIHTVGFAAKTFFNKKYITDLYYDYIDRVYALGGTVEGLPCLKNKFQQLGFNTPAAIMAFDYKKRVELLGGTVEGYDCLIQKLTILKNNI